jgi:hypothetical protein
LAVLFIFLDGFGLGRPDDSNPFWRYPAPFLEGLLGQRLTQALFVERSDLLARGVDACLGVPGVPQSATGQTALFTGVNAPALLGTHVTGYPNGRLQEIIAEHSILKRAAAAGRRATFANAYTDVYWQLVEEGKRRHSATTLTNLAAGLPFRDFRDLARGQAVYWDFTHSIFPRYFGIRGAYRRPAEAGRNLATLGREYDLVLYESFLPDMIGHRRLPHTPRWLVHALDAFLQGVVESMRPADSLVLCSDHGNFEDMETKLHTENPVLLLVVGPAAELFRQARAITDVTPAILRALDASADGT